MRGVGMATINMSDMKKTNYKKKCVTKMGMLKYSNVTKSIIRYGTIVCTSLLIQFKKIHLETLHSNSKITHNFSKINKRPQWNKRPPWNFARKLISVHHLIRASTLEIFSENNKRPWMFIR